MAPSNFTAANCAGVGLGDAVLARPQECSLQERARKLSAPTWRIFQKLLILSAKSRYSWYLQYIQGKIRRKVLHAWPGGVKNYHQLALKQFRIRNWNHASPPSSSSLQLREKHRPIRLLGVFFHVHQLPSPLLHGLVEKVILLLKRSSPLWRHPIFH